MHIPADTITGIQRNVRYSQYPFIKHTAAGLILCLPLQSLLLAFGDHQASAEWVAVEKPYPVRELQTLYIDPATILREGNLVEVWQLTDYRWMQGGPKATPRFLSTTTHKQFECMDKRLRLLAYTEFSHRMAAGIASNGYVDKDKWLPVEPDSINEALWEILCTQP
ncbi:MAG: hypothetical protein K2Q17_17530 [Nitrospiraceae bacterium]|jgi:hypothetical protein|uniref:surface-adhesin E family protein n=1 Tax=Nitrospira cf. moscoviensis SBR1015 TaxID=96242 RepID=UPI000A0DF304|nr:surface-adhesin E family protein [Nitrospira cf. moscoviensis SBR1015]MBY0249459.1 hypothetical protein [Nitrospiraceae bacterium]OQW33371.1 MAG: hypothetical protein A4E20_12930 [Nitrospira sp. SG-bin2]